MWGTTGQRRIKQRSGRTCPRKPRGKSSPNGKKKPKQPNKSLWKISQIYSKLVDSESGDTTTSHSVLWPQLYVVLICIVGIFICFDKRIQVFFKSYEFLINLKCYHFNIAGFNWLKNVGQQLWLVWSIWFHERIIFDVTMCMILFVRSRLLASQQCYTFTSTMQQTGRWQGLHIVMDCYGECTHMSAEREHTTILSILVANLMIQYLVQ